MNPTPLENIMPSALLEITPKNIKDIDQKRRENKKIVLNISAFILNYSKPSKC